MSKYERGGGPVGGRGGKGGAAAAGATVIVAGSGCSSSVDELVGESCRSRRSRHSRRSKQHQDRNTATRRNMSLILVDIIGLDVNRW